MGSYRIWILDLSKTLNELGHNAFINKADNKNMDVIIVGKDLSKSANKIKSKNLDKKVGLINPDSGLTYDVDFFIVSSIEELDSLSKYENVFIYPLIERIF